MSPRLQQTTTKMRDLTIRALGSFGALAQLAMVQEECGELIAAINWSRRNRCSMDDLAGEIADVEIMLDSARFIVGDELVDQKKAEKLFRLKTTLEAYDLAQKEDGGS